jgi:ubiquitin-protein ligase
VANSERERRLTAEWQTLTALKAESTVFDFQAVGQPPDKYAVTFRGCGLRRESSQPDVGVAELHQAEIRLTLAYPQRPPDLRWLTSLFHPNISFSGFIALRDIGLNWEEGLTLDIVCERLWDVVRLAYYDLQQATNYAAKRWLETECRLSLPLDPRPLRDLSLPSRTNVIRYARRDGTGPALPNSPEPDVLFIGDETPLPPGPWSEPRVGEGEDGILYIGDDP